MTQDHARALIERLKDDRAFRSRVLAEELPGRRLSLIRDEGYDCTAEEIRAASGPLPDAELGPVTGGGCLIYEPCAAYDWSVGGG